MESGGRERKRERQRETKRQRETDRQGETDREIVRERERVRETDSERALLGTGPGRTLLLSGLTGGAIQLMVPVNHILKLPVL
jgi:hypothetical protein